MKAYIYVCEPDENGVYRIGDKFMKLTHYVDPFNPIDDSLICCICGAHQLKPRNGMCAVCGYDIFHCKSSESKKYKEENKENILKRKEDYLRKRNKL